MQIKSGWTITKHLSDWLKSNAGDSEKTAHIAGQDVNKTWQSFQKRSWQSLKIKSANMIWHSYWISKYLFPDKWKFMFITKTRR